MEEVKKEITQESEKEQVKVSENAPENIEQINWKRFREQREIERKQKEAMEVKAKQKEEEASALKLAMETLLNNPSRSSPVKDDDIEESEDERIDKKVQIALEKKEAEYEKKRQEIENASLPQKLQQTYSDFESVCTTENLDYLEYHYPEVAAGIRHMPQGFERWSTIYKAVKRFIPNPDNKKDDAKIQKNLSKPQSMSAVSTGTGDHAPVILNDARRAANWQRMQNVMKGGK